MKKQVIITGASRGIGFDLANQLLSQDYTVIGTSRVGEITGIQHEDFKVFQLDLSDTNSILKFTSQVKNAIHKIDLLINNAGIGPDLFSERPDLTSYESTFDVNVKGTVMMTEQLLGLIPSGGRILNVSSKMGAIEHCMGSDSVAYRMSKSALNMYTKILSNRLNHVDVAAIHPGWVKTTIANERMEGRLTARESATGIIKYIDHGFKDGDFWDVEGGMSLSW